MPCTTTQNTIGATIIVMSLRKPSLNTSRPLAKSGAYTPIKMPTSAATRTWRKSEWYMRPRAGRDADKADVVIAGHPGRGGTTQDTQERRRALVGATPKGRRRDLREAGV